MRVDQDRSSHCVIWHDLECGAYGADLPLWRSLAATHGGPVLDVGAGTGRIALDLARHGHQVTALDQDAELVAELERRSDPPPITTVVADARQFDLGERFALIIVPMQTIQLLGGSDGRRRFLARARGHLRPGAATAVAITETLERFSPDDGLPLPMPDMREIDGIVYSSQPTAVREDGDGFVLERLRERIARDGSRTVEHDVIRLDRLTASELEREARAEGLRAARREVIAPTIDHVGSVVVILGG
jgi:SAM-dependent methyltransferase